MTDADDDRTVPLALKCEIVWRALDHFDDGPDAYRLYDYLKDVSGPRLSFGIMMFCLGVLAAKKSIAQFDPEQPWTGQWTDVRWKTVAPYVAPPDWCYG